MEPGPMPSDLEVEIKLLVADPERTRQRLAAIGVREQTGRCFEDNQVFDFPDRRLRDRDIMFRLRRVDGSWTLTLKERVPEEGDYKIRREYETQVADGESVLSMIRALGMENTYHYQKYRRTYRAGDTVITLDELPIGNYLELEGPPEEIDRLAADLGYSRDDYINVDYRTLHKRTLEAEGFDGEPTEMVFTGGMPS
jgi:adenylate cyclase class 2